ncbi:Uncharacterised protein [Segatella copri]|nr:Uncharacterised protein [Segatella copri]
MLFVITSPRSTIFCPLITIPLASGMLLIMSAFSASLLSLSYMTLAST